MRKGVMAIGVATLVSCASALAAEEPATSNVTTNGPSAVANAPEARASGAAEVKVPMPPTNVRVEYLPATELIDRVFQRSGVEKDIRSVLIAAMKDLSSGDLTYLAKGSDPSPLGLASPELVNANDWRNLVQAYAEATMVDRKGRSDFLYQLTAGVLLAVVTFILGRWSERRRLRTNPGPPTQLASGAVPNNHSKRRRHRKGR
jgi:hypothetical protein